MQTLKNNFKSSISSLDLEFPISEWDRLLDESFLTLNLFRTASSNP